MTKVQRERRERAAERDRIVKDPRSYRKEIGLNYAGTIVPSVAQAAFIYVMCDPRSDHNCVYIGQTSDNVLSRMYSHLSTALSMTTRREKTRYRSYSPVNRWLRELHEYDLRPVICVLDVVSQRYANQIEKAWIKAIAEIFEEDCLNCVYRNLGTMRQSNWKLKRSRDRDRELPELPPLPRRPVLKLSAEFVLTPIHPAFYEESKESVVYCPIAPEKGPT